MEAAKTESTKPVLSLTAVIACASGGFYFGVHVAEEFIFYMNWVGVTALTTKLVGMFAGGGIGLFIGLLFNKYYVVKKWGA